MKRRPLLVAAFTGAISGCQIPLLGENESLRLGIVEMINHVERDHQLHVEIVADGDAVHETTVALEAAEPNQPTGAILEKNWPDQAQSYTIRVDSDVEDDPVETTLEEPFTETCEPILLSVRPARLNIARGTRGECYD